MTMGSLNGPTTTNAHEKTPLVKDALNAKSVAVEDGESVSHPPLRAAPKWQFWSTTSASHRFFLLLLISCIPFGGHFVKNGMSALEPLMVNNAEFPISNTMYGALVSAVSVPNMFIPLFGGRLLDKSDNSSIKLFLVWICIGQAIFTMGMDLQLFWLALFGRIFFGIGEGSVIVGGRMFIARWFCNKELTFAMGVSVAITNLSKMSAKATVAPVALYFGGYVYALWYGFVVCLTCVIVGFVVCRYTDRLRQLVQYRVQRDEPLDEGLSWLKDYADSKRRRRQLQQRSSSESNHEAVSCMTALKLSPTFWMVAVLDIVFVSVFHLFQNVSSSYLNERYGYSVVKSGLVSAVSHTFVIFAPFIGLFIDQFGGRMYWISASALLSILAYGLMIFTEITPVVSMLLISLCLSFTPTILMATIPSTVSRNNFGAAFGTLEVMNAVGATFGNLLIGFLRDKTGSYDLDMFLLLGMAVFAFLMSVVLVIKDERHGGMLSASSSRRRTLSVGDDEPMEPVALSEESESPPQNQPTNGYRSTENVV